MATITETQQEITHLKQEYAQLRRTKNNLPRLSQDDHESITDNYQMHLEINAELECISEEINALEKQLEEPTEADCWDGDTQSGE